MTDYPPTKHLKTNDFNLCPSCRGDLSTVSARTCPECYGRFCDHPGCWSAHASTDSVGLHACCSVQDPCSHCGALFCRSHSFGTHTDSYSNDASGHSCCAQSRGTCSNCNSSFCLADVLRPCAECGKSSCPTCKPRDLCDGCRLGSRTSKLVEKTFHVQHERMPLFDKLRRPFAVDGPLAVSPKKSDEEDEEERTKRGTPPPPLVSGKAEKTDDIEELKQFDRGHIVALEIGGLDSPYLIAPMNKHFNQHGNWRSMERSIARLVAGTDLTDVDGKTVSATTTHARTKIDLSLRSPNVVNNTKWHIEVSLFYEDSRGDPRVPVWLYVRVSYNKKVWTHFSLANRCVKAKTFPTEEECVQFQAAADIYANLKDTDKVASKEVVGEYGKPDDPLRPNQILQFMRDVNARGKVFPAMTVENQYTRKAFTPFQIEVLRKFNYWKNGGKLLSDVQQDGVFADEKKDRYPELDECGGRASPEVDHIQPSAKGGLNSYLNARLVSGHHNHVYRDKPESGSRRLNELLLDYYANGALAFTSKKTQRWVLARISKEFFTEPYVQVTLTAPAIVIPSEEVAEQKMTPKEFLDKYFADDVLFEDQSFKYKVVTKNWPYRQVLDKCDVMNDRQGFLQADVKREAKAKKEEGLDSKYKSCDDGHKAGLAEFIDNAQHPERIRLLKLIQGAGVALCQPSDQLDQNGGMVKPKTSGTDPVFPTITAEDARKKQLYADTVNAWKKLGIE